MHKSAIAADIWDRVVAIRGENNQIAVDPTKTAHLVIDLQVGFLAPGALVEAPIAREVVANVNLISQSLRAAGGAVVHLQFTYDPDEPHYWEPMYGRMAPDYLAAFEAAFSEGADQHKLWPDLDVQPHDLIVPKTRFSGFIPGTSPLDDILRARGIDTLIITGTVTNCCCESTARDAMQMGYKVLFVQDGNACHTDDAHNATLANMVGSLFADVVTADEAIARIVAGAANESAR